MLSKKKKLLKNVIAFGCSAIMLASTVTTAFAVEVPTIATDEDGHRHVEVPEGYHVHYNSDGSTIFHSDQAGEEQGMTFETVSTVEVPDGFHLHPNEDGTKVKVHL